MPRPVLRSSHSYESDENRLARIVSTYDSQGDHRTATHADTLSAMWLRQEVRELGISAACESFFLNRVDPRSCYLQVDGRHIGGVPLFDARFTSAGGVSGKFGVFGSDADIALLSSDASMPTKVGEKPRGALEQIRSSGYKGIVMLTVGARAGLSLINATFFGRTNGPPTIQISSEEATWLQDRARRRMAAKLVLQVSKRRARGLNVTARVPGANKTLSPIVISTPRSGWWHCASERGGGLACWLDTMRLLSSKRVQRDCYFVALTGHELGFLGIKEYLRRRPALLERVHTWIHFGANLGAPRSVLRLQTSDGHLRAMASEFLTQAGAEIEKDAAVGGIPRGEASILQRNGVRYLAPIGESAVFHHASDRWPDALDIAGLARQSTAFSHLVLKLASNSH